MKTAAIAAALVAAVAALDASDLPECWSVCFNQYDIQDENCLCKDDKSKIVDHCIRSGCDSADSSSYESWFNSFCAEPSGSPPPAYPASAPPSYPSGSPPSYPSGSPPSYPSGAPPPASYPAGTAPPAPESYPAPPAGYPSGSPSGPAYVTHTNTVTATTPCDTPTRTPGEVYTTTTTESVTLVPHEKSYHWGSWESHYTSFEHSTCTGHWTVTVTHPGPSGAPVAPTGGAPSGYPPAGAPSGYPEGGYPEGGYPSGGGGWGSSLPSPTKQCSKPKETPKCTPCEGQGKGPWCGLTIDDNWYEVAPITCNVKTYEWEITQGTVSPDGVERFAFLVNNQFPGPMIEANWGDTIVVKLTNSLPPTTLNGTSLHFHGIRQNGTTEMDGVSSLSQCPLAPGDTMTYTWTANSYGTSWWHAHYALQTYEGIFGPMIIHGPASAEYDDEEFIILQDWNHATVDSLFDDSQVFVPGVQGGPITLDTGLINGKNVWEGGGSYYSMTVVAGKKYRLRLVNTAIQSTFKFHIDGHSFSVIAMDFVPIHPYTTDIVSINIGQRYDLIMEANQEPGNYWIRSDNQQPCGPMVNPYIQGILTYHGVAPANPTTTGLNYPPDCLDEASSNLVPIVAMDVGAQSGGEFVETSIIAPNGQNPNLYKWTLSGSTFLAKWEDPTLYDIWATGSYPDYSGDLTIQIPNLGEWVYFVIDSPMPLPHPIHLHGHDFFVLASGTGTYTPDVALNMNNPPRRDVAVMPADPLSGQGGYLVIAYVTSNPGVWLLHCHIGWHNAMGFALQIIEDISAITVEDSCQLQETCDNWKSYAAQYNVYNAPFDSGV